MRDFPEVDKVNILTKIILSMMPQILVAKSAYLGVVITTILFVMNLLAPLPFHPFYGFSTVFIGAIGAYILERNIRSNE